MNIGGDYHISIENIICIFDINTAHKQTIENLLKNAQKENRLIYACDKENACSIIAVKKDNKNYLYISPVSAVALGRRRYKTIKEI